MAITHVEFVSGFHVGITLGIEVTDVDQTASVFSALISEKAPLQKALEIGCEAAALKCLKAGAQAGMPSRDAIKALSAGRL